MWTFKPLNKTEKKNLRRVRNTEEARRRRSRTRRTTKTAVQTANLALKRANRKPRSRQ